MNENMPQGLLSGASAAIPPTLANRMQNLNNRLYRISEGLHLLADRIQDTEKPEVAPVGASTLTPAPHLTTEVDRLEKLVSDIDTALDRLSFLN